MAKKKKQPNYKEKTIALKDAESLTVEQLSEKTDALTAQNKDNESTLDKYIREHRSEIESAKKVRLEKTIEATNALDTFVKTVRNDATSTEKTDSDAVELVTDTQQSTTITQDSENQEIPETPVSSDEVTKPLEATSSFEHEEDTTVALPTVASDDNVQEAETKDNSAELAELTDAYDEVTLADDATLTEAVTPDETALQDEKTLEPELNDASEKEGEVISQAPVVLSANADIVDEPVTDDTQDDIVSNVPVVLSETPEKHYKKPIIIGLCALILLTAGGLVWHNHTQTKQKEAENAKVSSQQKSEEAKQLSSFNQKYAAFFVDDAHTKLKNSQFSKISELESELDKLSAHPDYQSLKTKVAELKTEIKTIQDINNQFNKAVVSDGNLDKTAEVKDGVTLSYTATENDTLNNLLKAAVAQGQAQQAAKAASAKSAAEKSAADSAAAQQAAQAAQNNASNQASANQTNPTTPSGATTLSGSTGSGLSTAQFQGQFPSIALQTSKSRVPVDPNADLSNPAFGWADGIKDLVLGKCRQRGYISGDAYILLPASIQKGNGYYNLYKPDGTYLVSINCKTGYFVGNAAGHADNLDY